MSELKGERGGREGGGEIFRSTWYLAFLLFPRNIGCSVAGITSDANVLTNYLRQAAQRLVSGWLVGQ